MRGTSSAATWLSSSDGGKKWPVRVGSRASSRASRARGAWSQTQVASVRARAGAATMKSMRVATGRVLKSGRVEVEGEPLQVGARVAIVVRDEGWVLDKASTK